MKRIVWLCVKQLSPHIRRRWSKSLTKVTPTNYSLWQIQSVCVLVLRAAATRGVLPAGDSEVTVLVDVAGALPPQLQGHRGEVASGGLHHHFAHRAAARVEDVIEPVPQQLLGLRHSARHHRVQILGTNSNDLLHHIFSSVNTQWVSATRGDSWKYGACPDTVWRMLALGVPVMEGVPEHSSLQVEHMSDVLCCVGTRPLTWRQLGTLFRQQ